MKKVRIISSVAEIFTLSMIFVSIFNIILSGNARELSQISEIFALCGKGISLKALAELLFMAVVIALVKYLWFSDRFFKNMLMSLRITFMLISVFVIASAASIAFNWFPKDMWQAWAGFIFSFLISTVLSFAIMMVESAIESNKYSRALTQYQNSNNFNGEEGEKNDGCD